MKKHTLNASILIVSFMAMALSIESKAFWQESLKPITYTVNGPGQQITSLAIGTKNTIWVTIADGSIWQWSQDLKKWIDMSTKLTTKMQAEVTQAFDKGRANQAAYFRCKQLIAAPDGSIWAIGFNNKIYFWQE